MPGKHNAGGCGCCDECGFCSDLYARNWVFSLCNFTSGHAIVSQIESAFDNLSFTFPSSSVNQTYATASAGTTGIAVVGACVSPSWTTETHNLEEINPSTGLGLGTYEDIYFFSPHLVINFITGGETPPRICDPIFHWYLQFSGQIVSESGGTTDRFGLIGNKLFSGASYKQVTDTTHCLLPHACPYLVLDYGNKLIDCTHDLSSVTDLTTGTAGVQITPYTSGTACTDRRAFRNPISGTECTLAYNSAPSGDTVSAITCPP